MNRIGLAAALEQRNVRAFLRVIREGETNQTADAYRMQFGGGLFAGPWRHPNTPITRGQWTSTAAGAYQFLYRTWVGLVRLYGFPDFSPESQDLGAVALVYGRGALQDVLDGRLDVAIAKCGREWASLPGAPYGQPTLTLARCRRVYAQYGGVEFVSTPVITSTEGSMDPLSLAGLLVGAFSPLIKAKAQQALGGEVGGQLADNLVEVVKTATGKTDPLEAVAVARQQPAIVQKLEQTTTDWLAQMAPILDKLAAYESAAWAAEESSRTAAADRGQRMDAEGFWHSAQFWIAAFILMNVSGVVFTVLYRDSFSSDMQSFVIGAIVGSALTAIISYFFGSSRNSAAKDAVIGQLAERRP